MAKAQSPAEFILVIFLFLIIILFLFNTLFIRTKPEIEKAEEQTACAQARALSDFIFKEPGTPANWNQSTLQVFGLSTSAPYSINYSKWSDAKALGYVAILNSTPIDASYRINYDVYAFSWVVDPSCPTADNSTVLCRNATTLSISANSSQQAQLNLELFFPFSAVTLTPVSLELDDTYTLTALGNGTLVELSFNTNTSDKDGIDISPSQPPNLVFIKKYSYSGARINYPIYLRDTALADVFGSAGYVSAYNKYCGAKRTGLLVTPEESILINLDLVAW